MLPLITVLDAEQTPKHGVEDLIGSIVAPSEGVAVCEVNPAPV